MVAAMSSGVTGFAGRIGGVPVAGAVDGAGGHAAAGEHHGVAVRPVVAAPLVGPRAAGDLADLGGPAELAHRDDERLVEQAPVVEVGQQGRETAVEHRQDRLLQEREVLAVRVPALVVAGAGADGHQPHARLDQAAGQEQALAQVGQAAELARLLGPGIIRVEPVPLADRRGSRDRSNARRASGLEISAKALR